MTAILRVEASIKGENSVSRKLTDRLVARLLDRHADASLVSRDVSTGVNPVDANWIGAMFTPAENRTDAQKAIVAYADELLAEVKAADIIVIGLPVYNFNVPSQLKSWIDQLARRGETFIYTEAGPKGLLEGKKAIIAMASDGTKQGSAIDFASGYVKHMMNFFGITDVEIVAADAIAYAPDVTVPKALEAVEALAL
ncbi:MAG: NAD(P)H-dependent oxidoreductase [Paracoccaceae bacterium]|nr:NAD(P)H-dependent oxidoreductase [Paracoccaceae bacterium]MDE3122785.1 NAD(P)H-dependent oxidoreductase [Paracoccaceae bacterium]MDE3240115.1 NAD(P)H-dependent oxidoreductase [Paracoccaceae bacterium]